MGTDRSAVIQSYRRERAEGEPLDTQRRKVVENGTGSPPYINIPSFGARYLDISIGEELVIHTYPGFFLIERPPEVPER